MSYYEVPDHTHIADVSLQRSDRGYAVTATFVTLPERAADEPYTDSRTWHIESSNLWRDMASAGWGMDHYDRLIEGHRIHAVPSVGNTQPLPEMLATAASRAHLDASDSERQAYNDNAALRAQLREYTHPHGTHPDPALHLDDNQNLPEQQHLGTNQRPVTLAEFELSHVEPQDNVYAWFKTAITQMATYGQHDDEFGLSELTDGWKLLSKHGPGSPEVTEWFADRASMPPYPLGDEPFHPHQGSSAHQSTIEHFYRFQHEFNGHVDAKTSANVAAARQSNRQLHGLDPVHRAAGPLSAGPEQQQFGSTTKPVIVSQRPDHLIRKDHNGHNRGNNQGRRA